MAPQAPLGALPRLGDIVIRKDAGSRSRFSLSEFPNPPQISYDARPAAEAQARRFASQHRVDCWLTDDGTAFELLERFRP